MDTAGGHFRGVDQQNFELNALHNRDNELFGAGIEEVFNERCNNGHVTTTKLVRLRFSAVLLTSAALDTATFSFRPNTSPILGAW